MSNIRIPVPPSIDEQKELVDKYHRIYEKAKEAQEQSAKIQSSIYELLTVSLGIIETPSKQVQSLSTVKYSTIDKWGIDFLTTGKVIYNRKYPTKPIGSICESGSGGTPSRSVSSFYGGSIPWIKTGEVLDDIIYNTEEKITPEALNSSSAKVYPKNSIVIAMYGQGMTRGRTAKLGIASTTNQACLVLFNINTEIVLTDYLWYYLQGEYYRLRALAYGNNQPNLNARIINEYPIVIPPIISEDPEEITQTFLVAEIDKRKRQIKNLNAKVNALKIEAHRAFEEAVFGEA